MKTITIKRGDILGHWNTPPEYLAQGTIVTFSYACTDQYILEKLYDRSECYTQIRAYKRLADATMGAYVGTVTIGD